jgi:hypothetical protein
MASSAIRERLLHWSTLDQNLSTYLFLRFCFIHQYFHYRCSGTDEQDRWRSPDNLWKKEPFLVTALPTVIKVTADGVSLNQKTGALRY